MAPLEEPVNSGTPAPRQTLAGTGQAGPPPAWRVRTVLFLCGANIFVLQFMAVRNLASALMGTELILFLIVASHFAGYSLGYLLSGAMGERLRKWFLLAQWASHLCIPFAFRWAGGTLTGAGWNLTLLAVSLILGGVWLCSLYTLFLPLWVDADPATRPLTFAEAYAIEIAGALCGLLLTGAAGRIAGGWLIPVAYQAGVAGVMALTIGGGARAAAAIAWGAYALAFPPLQTSSSLTLIRGAHGVGDARLLFADDTAYQRVEIIEAADGSRHLYLDGIRHYGSAALGEFNYLVSGLPAGMLAAPRTLVVGSGSFWAVKQALGRNARVTSVELDPVVAREGRLWLAPEFSPEELSRWNVVIDDAKHFLAVTPETFDLIVMDIAGPWQRQVAWLYTTEFYDLARGRLREGGILAVCLNGDVVERGHTASRILATLLGGFPQVYAVARQDGRSSFALAGAGLRFGKEDLVRRLERERPDDDYYILDRADLERHLHSSRPAPITTARLEVVLRHSWRGFMRRYVRSGGEP